MKRILDNAISLAVVVILLFLVIPLPKEILDILLDFVQDEENSVFMSSHIISDLEKVCDYITFIKDGRIIFSAEKERLTEQYGVLRCSNSDFEKVDKSEPPSSDFYN